MFAPNQPPQQPSPEQVAAGCRGCITAVGGFVGVCVGTIFLGGLVVGTATHHLEAQKVRECMTSVHEVTLEKMALNLKEQRAPLALIGQGNSNWVVMMFHHFGIFALKF
jgi:hypothetical protein